MSDSREELLEAAWQLVVESFGFEQATSPIGSQVTAKILEQLKAADIASRAEMTTGAFYNRWPNREAFLTDFLDYALSVERSPTFAALGRRYAEVADKPILDQLQELAILDIEQIASNPSFAIQTHLWSVMRSRPDIIDRMKVMYKDFREPLIPMYEIMIAGLGRELRPPVTIEQLSNLIGALAEGVTMQVVAGGDGAPEPSGFATAVLAWVPVLTRVPGDERTVAEAVAEMITP